jgi:hypothetical protein
MWIKDRFGDLVNLEKAEAIYVLAVKANKNRNGGYVVGVRFSYGNCDLTYPVNENEAEQIIDRLAKKLGADQRTLNEQSPPQFIPPSFL